MAADTQTGQRAQQPEAGTLQTPLSPQTSLSAEIGRSPVAPPSVEASPGEVGQSPLPSSPAASRSPRRISASAGRLLVGLALIALSFVAYTLSEGGLEPERQQVLTLSLAGVALVVSLFEATSILTAHNRLESPLELFAPAGVFLLALAGIGDSYAPTLSAPVLVVTGPVLAAGVLLLVRAAGHSAALLAEKDQLLLPPGCKLLEVSKGQRLFLAEGSLVSADVRIERGCCSVLERYLSPEPHFRIKEEGDVVFAGSEVVGGEADAIALSGSEESCIRSLEKLVCTSVERAGLSVHREDLRARTATGYILVFVSVACAILWDERVGRPWDTLAASGLVLFSGIVCQLADGLYVRQRAMVRRWARLGFVAASDRAVRELASATKILFDPSRVDLGSLVRVRELEMLDDRVGRQELTACLATLLGRAEDVALAAAGDFCQAECNRVSPDRVLNLEEIPGAGICGKVKGVSVLIGTEELLLERGVLIHPSESSVEGGEDERPLLVAVGGELVARFWVVFGQRSLVSADAGPEAWHGSIAPAVSAGIPSEITPLTLLVRGQESDVLGRSSELQISHFAGERWELPRSTMVSLTRGLGALPAIISDAHRYLRLVERTRILVAFGTFLSVATVFLGFFSPAVASICLALVAASLALL